MLCLSMIREAVSLKERRAVNPANTTVFISCSSADYNFTRQIITNLRASGWHLASSGDRAENLTLPSVSINDCDVILALVTPSYLDDNKLFVYELCYSACALRKPYLLVDLELPDTISAEAAMLAARDGFVRADTLDEMLYFIISRPSREVEPTHTERRLAVKPFEACKEDFSFISYAHDDAAIVYPLIKELYEQGFNLWYDEGIRLTERYLPEIAQSIKRCEVFLLFVTEFSITRPFVIDFELAYAIKLKKPIIAVMIDSPEQLPKELHGLTAVTPGADLSGVLCSMSATQVGSRLAIPPKDKAGEDYDITQLEPIADYTFELRGDGLVLKTYTGNARHVEVPADHMGVKVKYLDGTFSGNTTLKSVSLPPSIVEISPRTFYACKNLKSVIFSSDEHLRSIGEEAFFGCKKLKHFTLPASVVMVGKRAFGECVSLTRVPKERIDLDAQYRDSEGRISARLCYDSSDLDVVEKIWSLRELGFMVVDLFCESGYDPEDEADLRFLESIGKTIEEVTHTYAEQLAESGLLIVFLTPALLDNEEEMDTLRIALTTNVKLLLIYWSITPGDLPEELAASLGQLQGLFPSQDDFDSKLSSILKECGHFRNPLSLFSYRILNNEITITGYVGPLIEEVAIPPYWFNPKKAVTKISADAFKGSAIVAVSIPETVKEIGERAFLANNDLDEVRINCKKARIRTQAFAFCPYIETFLVAHPDAIEFEPDVFLESNVENMLLLQENR